MKTILYGWAVLFIILLGVGCSTGQEATPRQYTIEQFMDTKSFAGGTFTFDEKRILFSSDESGVYNVYSLSTHGGKQTQLTNSDHRSVMILSGFPHDDRFLYTTDELGDEKNHIYLREGDGTVRDLTPSPGAPVPNSMDGAIIKRVSFLEAIPAIQSSWMYMKWTSRPLSPSSCSRIHQGFHYGNISPNKHYLALQKINSMNDSDIYLYDLSSQVLKNITTHTGDIHFVPEQFSLDSHSLYYLTDEEHDFRYLKKFDLTTEVSEIVEKYDWDIQGVAFSHHGKFRITSINQDGRTVIHIYDQMDRKPFKLPVFPEGEIRSAVVSKSEKYLLLTVNGDRSPGNLHLYKIDKSTHRPLTQSLSPEMNLNDLVEAEIIRYPSYDGTEIPALFYKPKQPANGEKTPALIWVHGGPGGQNRTGYNYLIQYLVNHGYSVLAVNNRGSTGYGKKFYMAADLKHGEIDLDDCIAGKAFLISTGNIKEEKIGMIGGSYGGYMTLAAIGLPPR